MNASLRREVCCRVEHRASSQFFLALFPLPRKAWTKGAECSAVTKRKRQAGGTEVKQSDQKVEQRSAAIVRKHESHKERQSMQGKELKAYFVTY